jgi:hypothetical protein
MNLFKWFKKTIYPQFPEHCKCPHIIGAWRRPTNDDSHEFGYIWIFHNKDNNEYKELYYQSSHDVKEPLWIKYKKEVNESKKRNA